MSLYYSHGGQLKATQRSSTNEPNRMQNYHAVLDSRKRKIPRLRMRIGKFSTEPQIKLRNGRSAPRRVALNATNLDEAKSALDKKRTERNAGTTPAERFRPTSPSGLAPIGASGRSIGGRAIHWFPHTSGETNQDLAATATGPFRSTIRRCSAGGGRLEFACALH